MIVRHQHPGRRAIHRQESRIEKVGVADEVDHEAFRRMIVDVARPADLADRPQEGEELFVPDG
jgi:hypothetical protein